MQGGASGLNPVSFLSQTVDAVAHPAEWFRGQQACTQYVLQEAWTVNLRPAGQLEGALLGGFVLFVAALKLVVVLYRTWSKALRG